MSGTDVIKSRFAPWQNIKMWVLCNQEKIPVKPDGSLLQWKENPGDDINILDTIINRMRDGFGFGCIVGPDNKLVCYDFDHALNDDGKIINPAVKEFIEIVGSFVEISSSGKGLHLFIIADLPDGVALTEYGFKKSFCDGKCYPARFIKLTGNCLPGYDLPIQTFRKSELDVIERKLSNTPLQSPIRKTRTATDGTDTDWDGILSDVGILHLRSQYEGKPRTYPDGTTRTPIESYRIPCPNRHNHTGVEKRNSRFGPDAAILSKWGDGTSSLTCNHNACDPATRPNLLKMLWDEIRQLRVQDAEATKTTSTPREIEPMNTDNPRLKVNLPDNFVQHYIEYVHGLSDSYAEYQHGAALMLLSCAVNKRAYLPLTIGTIFPNLWVFCLGQSTVSRKTTACTKLTEFIELQNQWMLLSYPGSPEALVEDLEGEDRVNSQENIGHGILCRDEAGGILSAMEKTYMSDMRDLFCQLYDCRPFTRKLRTSQRKAKTTFNIRDTYLCMFFATTPDIFSVYTRLEDLTSGWLLRFLYYFPNYDHKLRDLSTMSDDDRERQKKIGERLKVIISFFKNHEIEFRFSISGLTFYNDWKNKHLTQMQRERQEDRGMFDRLSIYALKMAMLYTIGRDSMVDELKPDAPRTMKIDIDDDCLRTACEHIDQYFYPISKIVFDTVGRNEDKNVIEKILGTIRRAGGKITRTDLMKRAHIKKKELDEGIDTLIESTEIRENIDGEVTVYSM